MLKLLSILIGATFKGKNMLPMGSIFFLLIVAPFMTWLPQHCNLIYLSKNVYQHTKCVFVHLLLIVFV